MNPVDLKDRTWGQSRIRPDEVDRYLRGGRDFIDNDAIRGTVSSAHAPDDARLQALLDKALRIQDLTLTEAAELMAVKAPQQRQRMAQAALAVKQKVYGRCISAYAPIYLGDACVNSCSYCGFATNLTDQTRRVLSEAEISAERTVGKREGRHQGEGKNGYTGGSRDSRAAWRVPCGRPRSGRDTGLRLAGTPVRTGTPWRLCNVLRHFCRSVIRFPTKR